MTTEFQGLDKLGKLFLPNTRQGVKNNPSSYDISLSKGRQVCVAA